jgi:hypothetical protein
MNPAATRPRSFLIPALIFLTLILGWRGCNQYLAWTRLRIDMRKALGVSRGEEAKHIRAATFMGLPPAPPEILEKLQAAPRQKVTKLMTDHFSIMAANEDFHIMEDRALALRIRAMDLATTLGLIKEIRADLETVARKSAEAILRYAPPTPEDDETTSVARIRDLRFRNRAIQLNQAAQAHLALP